MTTSTSALIEAIFEETGNDCFDSIQQLRSMIIAKKLSVIQAESTFLNYIQKFPKFSAETLVSLSVMMIDLVECYGRKVIYGYMFQLKDRLAQFNKQTKHPLRIIRVLQNNVEKSLGVKASQRMFLKTASKKRETLVGSDCWNLYDSLKRNVPKEETHCNDLRQKALLNQAQRACMSEAVHRSPDAKRRKLIE